MEKKPFRSSPLETCLHTICASGTTPKCPKDAKVSEQNTNDLRWVLHLPMVKMNDFNRKITEGRLWYGGSEYQFGVGLPEFYLHSEQNKLDTVLYHRKAMFTHLTLPHLSCASGSMASGTCSNDLWCVVVVSRSDQIYCKSPSELYFFAGCFDIKSGGGVFGIESRKKGWSDIHDWIAWRNGGT